MGVEEIRALAASDQPAAAVIQEQCQDYHCK